MASKYVDTTAIMQVVGNVFNNPQFLDFTDKYTITEDDFPDEFHRVAFGAIYKIHELGADRISLENIADFLSSRPKSAATFKQNKGEEWLLKVSESCLPEAFFAATILSQPSTESAMGFSLKRCIPFSRI